MILFIQLQGGGEGGGIFRSLIPVGRFENNDCSYTFRQAKHCIVLRMYGPRYFDADELVVSEELGVSIFKGHRHIPEDLTSHPCRCSFFSVHFLFMKDLC